MTSSPADDVVAEIKAAGGEAVANYDDVADEQGARQLIATAIDAYGGLDAPGDEALDPGELVRVVQRAEVGVGYVKPAGRGVAGLLGQRGGEVGGDSRAGQHAGRSGAVLPGVEVARARDALRRRPSR
jgi:hypothetical protein